VPVRRYLSAHSISSHSCIRCVRRDTDNNEFRRRGTCTMHVGIRNPDHASRGCTAGVRLKVEREEGLINGWRGVLVSDLQYRMMRWRDTRVGVWKGCSCSFPRAMFLH
jgi:hypothetical protein